MSTQLDSPTWQQARLRAFRRDRGRCTVSRLLGGRCSGRLHVHHIKPRSEGGSNDLDNLATVCSHHHPKWEALRRHVLAERARSWRRCPHHHVNAEARQLCEERLNRDHVAA